MLPPAEKKGEVGYVEDWLPAPLVHQLAKGEGVDDCAHVGGGDHPRTADFLKRKEEDVEEEERLTFEQSHSCWTEREWM